jgi:hypothetical protein
MQLLTKVYVNGIKCRSMVNDLTAGPAETRASWQQAELACLIYRAFLEV